MSDLPRLYRPSPPEFFPSPDVVAMLDAERNIVHFRKDVFDTLSPHDQHRIYHMREKYLTFATTGPVFA